MGVALPLVSRSQGETTTMTDALAVSIPIGVVLRKNTGVPIDIAVAPTVLNNGRVVFSMGVNTAHGIGHGFAAGGGLLLDISGHSWGLATALDRVLLKMPRGRLLVADLFVPVQFQKDKQGARFVSVTLATHVGLAF